MRKTTRMQNMQKEYFTDKQQRVGLVSGAELVTYCTNISLEGKEWLN